MGNRLLTAAVSKVAKHPHINIPSGSRPLFCEYLIRQVRSASLAGPDAVQPPPYARLEPIVKQAAALRASLTDKRLSDGERKFIAAMLGCNLLTSYSFFGRLDDLAEGVKELMERRKALTGGGFRGRLGAPRKPLPWQSGAPVPEAFVAALISLVDQFRGTPLTLHAGGQKGTLLEALDLLAPHLPDGFLSSLPDGALERVWRDMRGRPRRQRPPKGNK